MSLPDSSEIVVANLTPAERSTAPEITTAVEHAAAAHVPEPTATEPIQVATPGQTVPDQPIGASPGGDDDEMDFFIKDIQRPEGGEPDTAPAPEGVAAPAEAPVSPTPAEPPTIKPELLNVAQSFGLSVEEAESYGSEEALLRTLNIIARNLPGVEETPAPVSKGPAPAAKPEPEPELDFPDPKELETEGFDPRVVKMAASLKAMHDRYKSKLAEVDKVLPNLVGEMQRRQAESKQRAVEESFKEAGFDARAYDAKTLDKIVSRVSGLYRVYQAEGIKDIPVSDLIKAAIPLVVSGAKPTPSASAPKTPGDRSVKAAELARQMERDQIGRFRGLPSHRKGSGGLTPTGGALRQTMLDKGYDPGEAPASPEANGNGIFLPG